MLALRLGASHVADGPRGFLGYTRRLSKRFQRSRFSREIVTGCLHEEGVGATAPNATRIDDAFWRSSSITGPHAPTAMSISLRG
jgi:hypothetical protein